MENKAAFPVVQLFLGANIGVLDIGAVSGMNSRRRFVNNFVFTVFPHQHFKT